MKLETYFGYLDERKAEIERGEPIEVQVVDREIFETKVVKAIVAKSSEALPDGQDLWIKNEREELDPTPWKIKIIEEKKDDIFTRPFRGLLGVGG